jgi:hypothetical protein
MRSWWIGLDAAAFAARVETEQTRMRYAGKRPLLTGGFETESDKQRRTRELYERTVFSQTWRRRLTIREQV